MTLKSAADPERTAGVCRFGRTSLVVMVGGRRAAVVLGDNVDLTIDVHVPRELIGELS
jgi:hypothetical protein